MPEPYRGRAKSITLAALLSLVIGIMGIVVGIGMLILDFTGSAAFASQFPPEFLPALELGLALGFGTSLVILVGSVMHLVGWYWLWGGLKAGGVVGAINGINDIIFPTGGGLWIAFYVIPSIERDVLSMPWVIQVLAGIGVVGIAILATLAIGWKTLKG